MLNYKHLHYFLVVAREGSIAKAGKVLHLTPHTISGQLGLLEEYLGEPLFDRVGRNLELNEAGRLVFSYADEIFSLGSELEERIRNASMERQLIFKVGITDVIPKSIAYRLLEPAYEIEGSIRIICREDNFKTLLGDLAVHQLDLIIADQPIPTNFNVNGFSRKIGESQISFFASKEIAENLSPDFPQCLNNVPLILPGEGNAVRNQLTQWLDKHHIFPRIVGEFDDSALMKAFGHKGKGVFIAPSAIINEITQQYGVSVIGETSDIKEQFYAISVERKVSHPAISAIQKNAREWLE